MLEGLLLFEYHSTRHQEGRRPRIRVGDVVLLHDESTKQAFWKLTIVDELIQGSDGKARGRRTLDVCSLSESNTGVIYWAFNLL